MTLCLCHLDFEVKESAVFVGSSGGLQVELCGASRLGQLCRFKHVVAVDAGESVLKSHYVNTFLAVKVIIPQVSVTNTTPGSFYESYFP